MSGTTESLLANLEPILGISVALNLAFLNIDKFQYIKIVRDRLNSKLSSLDARVKHAVGETIWYKQISDLASVDVLELEWPSLTTKKWIDAPGLWGILYNVFFYWRFGRTLSIGFTLYALTLLFLGAGHQSTATLAMLDYFNQNIGRHYFWSVCSALWPMITIAVGECVCLFSMRFVNYQTNNLKVQAINEAEATVKELEERLGS